MHLESVLVKPTSQRLEARRHRDCLTVRSLSWPNILIRQAMRAVMVPCVPCSGGRGTSLAWPNLNKPSRSAEKARAATDVMIVTRSSLYFFTQTALLAGLHGGRA